MRAIPTLVVAAMILSVVCAMPESKSATTSINNFRDVMHVVTHHVSKMNTLKHFMPERPTTTTSRLFDAMQAPAASCNQEAYSQAQINVLQACPSLSGLISGTVKPEDFLPTFCGSNCHTVMVKEVGANLGCVDSSTKFLLAWFETCKNAPQCFSTDYLTTGQAISTQCNTIDALADFSNSTTAARAAVTAACTGGCIDRMIAFGSKYGVCLAAEGGDTKDLAALKPMFDLLCKQHNSEYCAWNLRSLSSLSCESNCGSGLCDRQCKLAPTSTQLDGVCTPCLEGLAGVIGATGQDPAMFSAMYAAICSRVDPAKPALGYCYPLLASATLAMEASSLLTDAVMTDLCASSVGKCLPRLMSLGASLEKMMARETFNGCVKYYSSSYVESCKSSYEQKMRSAEATQQLGNLICATNAAGKNCYANYFTLGSDSCIAGVRSKQCPDTTTCPAKVATLATESGCCLNFLNSYLRASDSSYPLALLPPGTQTTTSGSRTVTYTFSSTITGAASADRSMEPLNILAACSNTSSLWTAVEGGCAVSATAVEKSLPVFLSWEEVNKDKKRREAMRDALRADTANQLLLQPSQIKKDDITENTNIQIQKRGTSQRQATGSGCKYTFSIDAGSNTASAATAFDSAVSEKKFSTPTLAATTTSQCKECLDKRATSIVSAAAAPASAGGSTNAKSPASSIAMGVSAVIAILAALLM